MLCAPRDENPSVADHAGHQTRDRATNMPLRIYIGVIEHGMTMAAHVAAAIGFAFDQYAGDPAKVGFADLRTSRNAEIVERANDAADIERVAHRPMRDRKPPAPLRAVTEHDHFVALDLDTRGDAGARRL